MHLIKFHSPFAYLKLNKNFTFFSILFHSFSHFWNLSVDFLFIYFFLSILLTLHVKLNGKSCKIEWNIKIKENDIFLAGNS